MKCIIYTRVSTEEQAKHGYSISAQKEKLEAYCKSQGWEIEKIYTDEGFSAKDLNRPGFSEMYERIKRGDIDVLLVYRLDRLTRSVVDLYKILKDLDDHKCMFKSATEIYDTTNAMGRLFITLVAAIAQWERENLAERVRFGLEKKTKLGKWKGGTPPYGYQILEKNLVVNYSELEVVKTIFHLSRSFGFYTIAKQLNEKGYPTRKGSSWHVDSIRDIANNPVYAGYLTFNEEGKGSKLPPKDQKLYEGIHERIISREEFWSLQEVLEKRKGSGGKRETSNYYFSTILKCGRCGHSMSGHKSAGKKTYRCSGKKAGKNCTSHIILEENLVKKVFSLWDELVGKILSSTSVSEVNSEKVNTLERELRSVQKLLIKQKAMFENDIIDIEELIARSADLRDKEKDLSQQLKNIQRSSSTPLDHIEKISENIETLWPYATEHERKEMINTIFSQIVIDTEEHYKRGTKAARKINIISFS
jgi:site-specific DNA recombinase